jgi:serine/threonine protein kinase
MTVNTCPYCAQPNPAQATACASCGNPLHEKLLPGTTLGNGRYRLERDLGQGGFGITYQAFDTNLHVPVAIKEFFPSLDGVHARRGMNNRVVIPANAIQEFEKYRQQTLTEARTLRGLGATRNAAIVKVQDLLEENNTAYIVMEFLEGQTLGSRIQVGKLLSEPEAREMLTQLLGALEQLHQQGILHLDIKPDNIVLTETGPVLIDFGAYRSMQNASQRTSNALTHGYAPLEQYSVTTELKPSTDLYALGATFYHALVGKVPTAASDRIKHKFDPRDQLRQRVSDPFAVWLAASLEMNQNHRPKSAATFGQSMPSVKGSTDRTVKTGPASRKKVPAPISATLAMVTALGVFAGGYWWLEQAKPKQALSPSKPQVGPAQVVKPVLMPKSETPPTQGTARPQPKMPTKPTASITATSTDTERAKLEAARKATQAEAEKAKAAQVAAEQAQAKADVQARQLELERKQLAAQQPQNAPAPTAAAVAPKPESAPISVAAKPRAQTTMQPISKPVAPQAKPQVETRAEPKPAPQAAPKIEPRAEPQVTPKPVEPIRAALPPAPANTLPLTVEFGETFRISYPTGWTPRSNVRDGGNDTRWNTPEQTVGVVLVHVNPQPAETNLQAITEALSRNVGANRSGYLQISSQQDTLAGETGWRNEYQIKNGQILTRGYTLAAIHDNRLYVLQLEAPFEQFATYWPVFERVRNSFQYL